MMFFIFFIEFAFTAFPFICILLSVAYFTLLERKLLGSIMLRKGPDKVGFMGLLQPFSDAGKLFTKELVIPQNCNMLVFLVCPGIMLGVSLGFWTLYPFKSTDLCIVFGFMGFLVLSSFSVYSVMFAGWSSNSKYSVLGCMRSVAQSISYEIPLMLIFFVLIYISQSFFLQEIYAWQENFLFFFSLNLFILMEWMVCLLAENNRSPFDFVEGESELVSGFNVEYSGGLFAMIFMSEYSSMLYSSVLSSVLFFGFIEVFMSVIALVLVLSFIWVRGTYPRMRYDKLMKLSWTLFTCVPLIYAMTLVVLI
uniref:NADH-ubiquinone oxidoreductase chain 1 n=1 Tax=Geukensia demissa TaxID=27807 RepID=A0A6B9VQR3_GEUDE|nr:NADH dehydrogenase subunit 1 [Geukensia demissa]